MDFERFKDCYQQDVQRAISFIGQELDFFTEIKARHILRLAERHLGDPKKLKVLDVGCGVGLTDRHLVGSFGGLDGVDVTEGLIEKAKQFNPSAHYRAYDGKTLPYADETFDLVFTICVMQCIPCDSWQDFIEEMYRVIRPKGMAVIFEHNPLNPLTRLVVTRCDMNKGLPMMGKRVTSTLLKQGGFQSINGGYILFFPWRGEMFQRMERSLYRLPFGAQYYVAGKK